MHTSDLDSRPSVGVLLALLAAIVTALLPMLRVITPGAWTAPAASGIVLILAIGWVCRARLPALAASAIAAAVGLVFLTAVFARDTALLGVIPTPATLSALPVTIERAIDEIMTGSAPLTASPNLSFVIVAAALVLTIALDHVVITTRMPLLASVALIAVYLAPGLAVHAPVRLSEFVGFAIALLTLIALETRERNRTRSTQREERTLSATSPLRVDGRSALATGVGIAAASIVAAVVVAPALPQPTPAVGGFAAGSSIDASLALGESLRQPAAAEVLRVRGAEGAPPYLRAVTLSTFDGQVWEPDRGSGEVLDDSAFGPVTVDPDVPLVESNITVDIVDYRSPWLPVPFPAVSVTGLGGEWLVLDENRTVLTQSASAQGQRYTVTTHTPRPTLEKIRASRADPGLGGERDVISLPEGEAALDAIREQALEVTAPASNDYDRLIALQSWFRNSFEYSLHAPVAEGFDGTGIDAIAAFLEVRQGYCVHFASAFAVMARALDMPSRIVVGYLPGTSTGNRVDGQLERSVDSTQLHAWPEVFFAGIGWIAFEPTATLGAATRFWPEATGGVPPGEDPGAFPIVPPTEPSVAPAPIEPPTPDTPSGAPDTPMVNPLPIIGIVLLVVAVLVLPAAIRVMLRRRRFTVSEWDVRSGWEEVLDTAIDLGIELPAGETPRAFGRRLVEQHASDPNAVTELVEAIERASYAPGGARAARGDVADAARRVCLALRTEAASGTRLLSTVFPRSLLVRAGSAFATEGTARAG